MKSYHSLAPRARLAGKERSDNDAAMNLSITGKVAENPSAESSAFDQENKASDEDQTIACPVNPNNLHTQRLHTLIKSPDVQARIQQARAHSKRQLTRKQNQLANTSLPTKPWKRTTTEEKFRLAGYSTEVSGGITFTLNLSDPKQRKLRKSRDPLRSFTDTLNRKLKQAGLSGLPYSLSLEESAQGKLHVHGFAILGADSEQAFRGALRASGGAVGGKEGTRQVDVKKLTSGMGWAFYCRKDLERTNDTLSGEARLFLSTQMRRVAKEFSLSLNF